MNPPIRVKDEIDVRCFSNLPLSHTVSGPVLSSPKNVLVGCQNSESNICQIQACGVRHKTSLIGSRSVIVVAMKFCFIPTQYLLNIVTEFDVRFFVKR